MGILDRRSADRRLAYAFQCGLAWVTALVVLAVFNTISNAGVVLSMVKLALRRFMHNLP
jgi:hypothetical protein